MTLPFHPKGKPEHRTDEDHITLLNFSFVSVYPHRQHEGTPKAPDNMPIVFLFFKSTLYLAP